MKRLDAQSMQWVHRTTKCSLKNYNEKKKMFLVKTQNGFDLTEIVKKPQLIDCWKEKWSKQLPPVSKPDFWWPLHSPWHPSSADCGAITNSCYFPLCSWWTTVIIPMAVRRLCHLNVNILYKISHKWSWNIYRDIDYYKGFHVFRLRNTEVIIRRKL